MMVRSGHQRYQARSVTSQAVGDWLSLSVIGS